MPFLNLIKRRKRKKTDKAVIILIPDGHRIKNSFRRGSFFIVSLADQHGGGGYPL